MRSKRSPELRRVGARRRAAQAAGPWRLVLPASGWAPTTERRRRRRSATAATGAGTASSRPAFVELAPPGLVGPAGWLPHDKSQGRPTGRCRLVVETVGARLSVELDRADAALVEAVCRLVLSGRTHRGDTTP